MLAGELKAYLTLDSTQFDRGMDTSGQKMSRMGSAATAAGKTVAGAFATAVTTVGGLGLAVGKVGYDYNRLQQSSRAALSTLLGGAEAANAQMDKLDAFAKTSPFAKQVFITAQQQLLGFGVAAEDVIPALDAIQNAVAAVGGSNDQVSQVTYALAQMQGQGKLTGETLNQLGQYGIDAATIVGKAMGKTGAQVRDLASKPGGIPVDQVWDPLVGGLMERFGGATDNIKQQMDGAVDRVKGAWRDIGSILAAPFVDPKGGGRAVVWANQVADLLRAVEQKAKPFVDLLLVRFGPQLGKVSANLDRMKSAVNGWDLSRLNGQLDRLAKYTPIVAGLGTAIFTLGSGSIPVLGRFLPALNPVVAGLVALAATSPELRELGDTAMRALAPLVPIAAELGATLSDALLVALVELAPSVQELVLALAPLISSLASGLTPAAVQTVAALSPAVGTLADLVSWVAKLPQPVLAAVAAFAALRALRLDGVFGPASTALRTFNDQAKVQAALAGSSSRAVGLLGAASVTAQSGVRALGGALKTAFISNPIGLALTVISTAIGVFVAKQQEARQRADELAAAVQTVRGTLDDATGAITANTRATVFQNLVSDGTVDKAKALGISLNLVTEAAMGNTDAIKAMRDKYETYLATAQKDKTDDAIGRAGRYAAVLEGVGAQKEALADAQAQWNDEQAAGVGVTERDTAATRENTDAKREAAGANLSLREAQLQAEDGADRFADAVKRAQEVQKDSEATDAEKAAALRDVESALLDQVRRYDTVTAAMEKNNASASELDAQIRTQREAFIKAAEQMGKTADEARALADSYGLIPNRVITEIEADAKAAQVAIDRFVTLNNGRRIKITVDSVGGKTYDFGPGMDAKATGGPITGGVPGRDSVPIMAMPGEHVFTTSDVRKAGGHGAMYRLRSMIQSGMQFFAGGGEVGSAERAREAARKAYADARAREAAARAAADAAAAKARKSGSSADQRAADRAQAALDKAQTASDKARDAREAATERLERLRQAATDLVVSSRRGEIVSQATSGLGGAYSVVDQLRSMASSGDYSKSTQKTLARQAREAEAAFKSLYSQLDKVDAKLADASAKVSELQQIKSAVASSLQGGFGFSSLFGKTDSLGYDKPVTKKEIGASAKAYAGKLRSFAWKLHKVQKMFGTSAGAILQELVSLGVDDGSVAADAILSMTKSESSELASSFKAIEKYSNLAGQYVTEGFYKGGLSAAEGVKRGLEKEKAAIEKKIADLAKRLEDAMRKAMTGAVPPGYTVEVIGGTQVGGPSSSGRKSKASTAAGAAGVVTVGRASTRTLTDEDAEAIGRAMARNLNGLAVKGEIQVTDRNAAALVQRGTRAARELGRPIR